MSERIQELKNLAEYRLSKSRGIMITADEDVQEEILWHLCDPENDESVLYVSKEKGSTTTYQAYGSMDVKELKKYTIFVFKDPFKHLHNFSTAHTRRFVQQSERGKKFIFLCGDQRPERNPAKGMHVFKRCGAFKDLSTAEARLAVCGRSVDGMGRITLLNKITDQAERQHFRAQLIDKTVDQLELEDILAGDDEHSKMGPSSLSRLEKCPGSYYYEDKDVIAGGAALAGTIWHAEAEGCIKELVLPHESAPIYGYVQDALHHIKQGKMWGTETTMRDGRLDPRVWGTVDFWSHNRVSNNLTVVDYKNGGYPVKAKDNLQLLAYAVMLCVHLRLKPTCLFLDINQRGKEDSWTIDFKDLKKAEERIKKIIKDIDDCKFAPEEGLNHKECFNPFCPAAQIHKLWREKNPKEVSNGKEVERAPKV